MEEQPASAAPPTPVPKQSPRPKRWHPSPDPGEHTLGWNHFRCDSGRIPQLQAMRDPTLEHSAQAELHRGIQLGL